MIFMLSFAPFLRPTLLGVTLRMLRARESLKTLYTKVRFGQITETIMSVDGGVVSEIEYRDRKGVVVGHWAYGSFNPKYPYRG